MVQYIITPWRSQADLLRMRQQLYPDAAISPDLDAKRDAVAKVMVWVQRGSCPHLIESTAILISAILNDVPGNSTYCVRAAYAAAFCRFVTGLLDSHQDKKRKLSMYSIAKTLGLPATYVELRHQATHEELPSLSKLRTATQKALHWIWDYYWARLTSEEVEQEKPVVLLENVSTEVNDTSLPENCKSFVRRLLQAEDEGDGMGIEVGLERWDQDELLEALMEVQGEGSDVRLMLRATKLQQRLLASAEFIMDDGAASKKTNWDDIKNDITHMNTQLSASDERRAEESDQESGSAQSIIKGWTMWEGPWVPKPIGVV